MTISKDKYASMPDGRDIFMYTLSNGVMEVRLIDYGATITHLRVPDRAGQLADVTLGYDSYQGGYDENPFYFGGIIGRHANRIAKGQFTLDGQTYNVSINNGPNLNHGGLKGFDKKLWEGEVVNDTVVMRYTSPDGEEGFPGEVKVTVAFRLTGDNTLELNYKATTSQPTVVNLTSHPYLNLGGHSAGSLDGHVIQVNAQRYTPADDTNIPLGELAPVQGTAFDLTSNTDLRKRLEEVPGGLGFDHNFVFGEPGTDKHMARVVHPLSGRRLDLYSSEPGMQLYTAYWVDEKKGKGGAIYGQWSGFALEAQHYPDSPNQPSFPSPVLRPGETYTQTTRYVFSVVQ